MHIVKYFRCAKYKEENKLGLISDDWLANPNRTTLDNPGLSICLVLIELEGMTVDELNLQ